MPKTNSRMQNELPTSRQLEQLACIQKLYDKYKKWPSILELADALGVNRNAALAAVQTLERKGLVVRPPKTIPGSPQVTKKGREWL